MSARPRLRRVLRRVVQLLLALALALVLLLVLALGTREGRNLTLAQVLPLVNDAIPGRVRIRDFSQLWFGGLELRGIAVEDPEGNPVLTLERLRLDCVWSDLRPDRVRIARVELDTGFVDLREISAPRRGLLAAFVDPDAPPVPPSEKPPPYVRIDRIAAQGFRLALPQATPLAPTEIRELNLEGDFELDGTPRARVDSLTLSVLRESKALARVSKFSARLGRDAEASTLAIEADLSGVALRATAEGVVPPTEAYESAPLTGEVVLLGIAPERVARLGRDPSLEEAFRGPLDLELSVSGSLHDLKASLQAHSPGGPVQLEARLKSFAELLLELETPGYNPQAVLDGAPDLTLRGRLSLEANIENAPGTLAVHALSLRDASVDGETLPRVDGSLLLTEGTLQNLKLELADEHSQVRVTGDAAFDGSAQLQVAAKLESDTVRRLLLLAGQKQRWGGKLETDLLVLRSGDGSLNVKGSLRGRQLAFAEHSAERIDVQLTVEGQPPALSGRVKVDATGLKSGGVRVHGAVLEVRGGPRKYAVKFSGSSNQGDVDLSLDLSLDRAHQADSVQLAGKIAARRDGHALDVLILDTRVNPGAKSIDTKGIDVRFGEQRLRLAGQATPKRAAFDVQAEDVDVSAFNPLLPSASQLAGRLTLDANVSGSTDRPVVTLELAGRSVSLGERPALDLDLKGGLDAEQGRAVLNLHVSDSGTPKAGELLRLALDAEAHFATERPWLQALEDAEPRARLELERLELAFVQSLLPDTNVPLTGRVRATLELEPEQLDLKLALDDAEGVWVDASATTSLPPLSTLLKNPSQLAQTERWRVSAQLAERKLSALPIPPKQRDALPSATVAGSLNATHEPGAEPEVDLTLAMRQGESIEVQPGCVTSELALDAQLALQQGRAELYVLGRQAKRELLKLEAKALLGLAEALLGGTPEVGKIQAKLESRDLELRQLPYLCERYGGRVSLTARLDDPLGSRPDARVEVKIQGLTAGSQVSVDTDVAVYVVPGEAGFDAKVRHGKNTSTAQARIPVTFGDGRLRIDDTAPVQGQLYLQRLPIQPFLDPQGAISYATGTLGGHAKLSGTLKRPRLEGAIELQQLGFTATDAAQPLRNIQGRIEFADSSVKLKGLRAQDKDGTLRLDGKLELGNTKRIEGQFRLRAKEFPLRQQGQVVATTDVDARIRSTLTPEKTTLRVDLHAVDTWLENTELRKGIALVGHPDVIVDGVPAVEPAKATGEGSPRPSKQDSTVAKPQPSPRAKTQIEEQRVTEIVLDASDKFWIKRDDFAVKLAASLRARIQGDAVNVEGKVEIDRGYLSLFGKLFDIQRGSELEFIGSSQPNPVLNIEAVHENRRSGEDITVRITGRGSAPNVAFFVDEVAVTAGDAFVALFGAQRSNEDPDSAGDQARDFVGGLTAGILATTARRELGAAAPVIMVEPGGDEETRLRAGFELDSLVPRFLQPIVTGLYFEGIVANDQDNNTQDANVQGGALLEIYFPNDFFTAGQYGPGSTWSVDVGWQL